MIKVTMANNVKRVPGVLIDENTTLRAALEANGINYTTGVMNLDGSPLQPGDLNKTFADFGYSSDTGRNTCFLMSVVKADNA